jgi:hypothetical protein
MKPKTLSKPSNLNVTPTKGTSLGQNLVASLARVQRTPNAGGTGLINQS